MKMMKYDITLLGDIKLKKLIAFTDSFIHSYIYIYIYIYIYNQSSNTNRNKYYI